MQGIRKYLLGRAVRRTRTTCELYLSPPNAARKPARCFTAVRILCCTPAADLRTKVDRRENDLGNWKCAAEPASSSLSLDLRWVLGRKRRINVTMPTIRAWTTTRRPAPQSRPKPVSVDHQPRLHVVRRVEHTLTAETRRP